MQRERHNLFVAHALIFVRKISFCVKSLTYLDNIYLIIFNENYVRAQITTNVNQYPHLYNIYKDQDCQ